MHILLAADLPWPGGGWGGHRYVASQCVVGAGHSAAAAAAVPSNKKGNNKINFAILCVSLWAG